MGLKRISGIEGKLVELIAIKMNFSYEYHIYDSQHIGYVFPNLSTTGVFKELAEGRADFALGGTSCTHFRMRLLPCSKQYFMSKVRVMLKPGGHYTALEVLFYPFKIEAWLLLFSLVNIRILLKLLSKHLEVHQGFVQLLLIAWLLMIFFYRISFEGSYFKFLHNQPLKPLPSNAEEMKKQKYGVVSDLCHIRFKEYYIDLKIGVIKDFTLWETIEFIRDTNEKIAALVNIEILTYYLSKNTEERGNFLVIKDGMMLDPLCIYFKRNSFLTSTNGAKLLMLPGATAPAVPTAAIVGSTKHSNLSQ
ncbi:uncharacterized protein LOC119667117 [Teleopsis dalmanni]|uniref:uncharacterized protein LOC119667117 n=1 Tax=Teleopsis dalmanni TaxID=139649 RepID=UPI0018CCACD3|nr:uncharacterized protein LOC119667117 [Teleopsis dalmanni]